MPDDVAPWLAMAGLGVFHGVNPGMGWLFAVALGLHRQSRWIVWAALIPIALGHALSVLAVVALVVGAGAVVEPRWIEIAGGLVLIGWAGWHWRWGHRHRVRIGMTTGMAGLALWSFTMATSHGAGLMLVPVIMPLGLAAAHGGEMMGAASLPVALAAVGVHTGTMLAVTAAIAAVVYEVFGVAFLRRGWINLDLVWTAALVAAGLVLLSGWP